MNAERWRRIENLFEEAAALAESERSAYLDGACAGDEELRDEVSSLLAHSGRRDLDRVVQDIAARLAEEEEQSVVGSAIGPYRVTGIVGRGGMGIVYRAERDDGQFEKQVAIKLIKKGMDSVLLVSRFRAERQILASLEHAGIARLLDGGATDSGQPYFVMEYVDGVPLTRYCADRALSVSERLRLFRRVCDAVQYAHANLVVHRDIKPSNILVRTDGQPKLLDFGLARVMAPSGEASTVTVALRQMMTPDYASPEQVRGERLTVATDVYSLGAVLYEALTGQRPHRMKDLSPPEVEQAVCRTEVERPSSAVRSMAGGPEGLARTLQGDLDNIVLKALRKEPERRYAGVEPLSRDILNYLERRPVEARPDTAWYRARKFVSRNRIAVAAATAAFLLIGATTAGMAWQAHRANRRFGQVHKLANVFLYDLHDRLLPLPGSTETRKFVVDTGLEYLASLERDAGSDPDLIRDLARGYLHLGDIQGNPTRQNLGDPKGAAASYQRAADMLRRSDLADGDRAAAILLAQAISKAGEVAAGRGDSKAGHQATLAAIQVADRLVAADADTPSLELAGYLHIAMTQSLSRQDDMESMKAHARRAIATYQELLRLHPGNLSYLASLSVSQRLLGSAFDKEGGLDQALQLYLEALESRRAIAAQEPLNPRYQRNLMLAHSIAGDSYRSRLRYPRDFPSALKQYEKMLEIAERVAAQDPADKRAQADLAQSLLRTGAALVDLERFSEGRRVLERALRQTRVLLAANPADAFLNSNRSFLRDRLAVALLGLGLVREAAAESHAAESLASAALAGDASSDNLIRALTTAETGIRIAAAMGDVATVRTLAATLDRRAAAATPEKVRNRLVLPVAPDSLRAAAEALGMLAAKHSSAELAAEACRFYGREAELWEAIRGSGATGGVLDTAPDEASKRATQCRNSK